MRKSVALSGAIFAAVMLAAIAQRASGEEAESPEVVAPQVIAWLTDPAAAAKAAREQKRPVVIYVSSENCAYCRLMERKSWTDEKVIDSVTGDYVALRVSPEKHGALVGRLNVSAFPTTIVLDQELNFHNAAAGYLDAQRLAYLLKQRPARVASAAPASDPE